jgi:Zn-dependent protease
MQDPLTRIVVSLPAFLLAIVLHELAHGYVAYLLGDDTAKRAGRLTISPVAHLDPVGTLFFLLSSWLGFGFGWAKPVPVTMQRLRNPWRDEVLVTLAGPAANLVQAVVWALLVRLVLSPGVAHALGGSLTEALSLFCLFGAALNVVLMVFNLLPIPPLDGSHVALRLLGSRDPYLVGRLAPLGFILLFLLVSTRAFGLLLGLVVGPLVSRLVGFPVSL